MRGKTENTQAPPTHRARGNVYFAQGHGHKTVVARSAPRCGECLPDRGVKRGTLPRSERSAQCCKDSGR